MDASPSKPKIAEFAIVMLVCRDIVKSRDFYRNLLGLPVLVDSPQWVDLDLGEGRRLGLHAEGGGLKVMPGSLQLGFAVPDVDLFVTDAKSMGVMVFQDPFDEQFGRLAILADPDGYAVQVYSPRR